VSANQNLLPKLAGGINIGLARWLQEVFASVANTAAVTIQKVVLLSA